LESIGTYKLTLVRHGKMDNTVKVRSVKISKVLLTIKKKVLNGRAEHGQAGRLAGRRTKRQAGRSADRQAARKADRQADRQTNR
jgi:hypothetical protein